jgi:hypothetical protein
MFMSARSHARDAGASDWYSDVLGAFGLVLHSWRREEV